MGRMAVPNRRTRVNILSNAMGSFAPSRFTTLISSEVAITSRVDGSFFFCLGWKLCFFFQKEK
jgi:hypothetical protein